MTQPCELRYQLLSIIDQLNNNLRKTVITTVITADTQCKNVVTNRDYESDLHNPTILKVGTVAPGGGVNHQKVTETG